MLFAASCLRVVPLVALLAGFAACADPDEPVLFPVAGWPGATSTEPSTIDVTFLANEGVVLSSGEQQVVIDGLYREYEGYPVLPPADRERIETAAAPFGDIDVVLVSHTHGDHFHPTAVARHLQHNPGATLVSSEQVTSAVRKEPNVDAAVTSRIRAVTPAPGQRSTLTVAGVTVEVLGLRHGWKRWAGLQNLGHIVTIGGKRVLHVGDAESTIANFAPLNLSAANIDVAILPGWFMTDPEGQTVIVQHIKPKQLIAVHLPASDFERTVTSVTTGFPGATAFTKLLERRRY